MPMRKCIGCNEMKPKKELIRIVSPAEAPVFLDVTGKANGRGAYICPNNSCLSKAKKARRLERTFNREIPEDVYTEIERLLTEVENDNK